MLHTARLASIAQRMMTNGRIAVAQQGLDDFHILPFVVHPSAQAVPKRMQPNLSPSLMIPAAIAAGFK